jgi:hypothetical protein
MSAGGNVVVRRALLLGGWAAFIGAGAALFGVWGAVGGAVAPFALLLAYAVVSYYGGALVRGPSRPVGDLAVRLEKTAVFFRWSADDATLPLGVLAYLDKEIWRWAAVPATARPGLDLAKKARAIAEARLSGGAEPSEPPPAQPGEATEIAIRVKRNRSGIGYSFTSSIGGPAETRDVAALSLLRYALAQPRGEQVAHATIALAGAYEAGETGLSKAYRRALAALEASAVRG